MEEIVGIRAVFTQPLQRRVPGRLDAMSDNLPHPSRHQHTDQQVPRGNIKCYPIHSPVDKVQVMWHASMGIKPTEPSLAL